MSNIIGNLPVPLQNGTTADASQVMSDLNFIVNQVNANAMPANVQTLSVSQVTITSVGNPNQLLTLVGTGDSNGAGILLEGNGSTTPNKTIRAQNGTFQIVNNAYTAAVFSVDDSGNTVAAGTISGSNITGTSDRRLKSRIKRIRNATETVLSWVGVTFQRKGDKTKRRHAGFIANDMQLTTPELVFEDEKGVKSLAYGNATAYLAEAFKELEARVQKLEKKQ
ncbi:tail fiber domain-containing protein [Burkholderia territorii]|uniref:tail fiber domain-containing protein n=1 Tax=Burkholderia territorii TaxID=1503055 RepID=UPI0007547E97|nr:tail fiber domain-containing protein [Burkholderia territorii]KWA06653.1 hypothetical protein WT36_15200 [Burkholderia territorii]